VLGRNLCRREDSSRVLGDEGGMASQCRRAPTARPLFFAEVYVVSREPIVAGEYLYIVAFLDPVKVTLQSGCADREGLHFGDCETASIVISRWLKRSCRVRFASVA
jgi:hypothetical protein